MELDVRELKRVIDAIFDHIGRDLKVDRVAIREDQDFYWEVPMDKLHAVKEAAPQLDVGRLSDDWDFLEAIPKDKDQAVALMLVHVAPLLRHIGQQVGQ